MRIIFHIDLNAFFANAELTIHPEYAHKPMVISHDARRSVVSTASYEARAFGIHSAMPLYMAKERCKDLIIVEPHFDLYRQLSDAFFARLRHYSTKMEIASIDECYMDMSDYIAKHKQQPYDVAKMMQQDVYEHLHLPCSIGISPNKFLSKMASDMKKPMGITIITQSNIKEVLWPLDIGKMHGIGKKTAPRLKDIGILTIGDLADPRNYDKAKTILHRQTLIYHNFANGHDHRRLHINDREAKSISISTTFEHDLEDIDEIIAQLRILSEKLSQRAQKQLLLSTNVGITLKYTRDNIVTRQMETEMPINDSEHIYAYTHMLLNAHYTHQPLRLLGITLHNVTRADKMLTQISLFDHAKELKKINDIDEIINTLNKNAHSTIMRASDILKKDTDE